MSGIQCPFSNHDDCYHNHPRIVEIENEANKKVQEYLLTLPRPQRRRMERIRVKLI